MPVTFKGSAGALATSVALPTHAVGDLIVTPQGAPTLAPADDKRQAYQKSSAEDDFSAEEQG